MKFIQLDIGDEDFIYLNIAHIIRLKNTSEGTLIFTSDQNTFEVKEDLDSIIGYIECALAFEESVF